MKRNSLRIWDIDSSARTCTCPVHGEGSALRVRRRQGQRALSYSCRRCDSMGGDRAAQNRRWKYRLSDADYTEMVARQAGACAICATEMTPPHIDHDHQTGAVRGLLCAACNLALGFMEDDPGRLARAIQYLRNPPAVPVIAQAGESLTRLF